MFKSQQCNCQKILGTQNLTDFGFTLPNFISLIKTNEKVFKL